MHLYAKQDNLILKLGRLYCTVQIGGFDLSIWEHITNSLHGIKLRNNLHSSSFPLHHLWKILHKFQATLYKSISLFHHFLYTQWWSLHKLKKIPPPQLLYFIQKQSLQTLCKQALPSLLNSGATPAQILKASCFASGKLLSRSILTDLCSQESKLCMHFCGCNSSSDGT